MPITVYNPIGDFPLPNGDPPLHAGERREISPATAAWVFTYPELSLSFDVTPHDLTHQTYVLPQEGIGFFGTLDERLGYGVGGAALRAALHQLGVSVKINPFFDRSTLPYRDRQLPWIPLVEIAHCLPDLFPFFRGAPYRVGWTMWETSRLPDGTRSDLPFGDWAALINQTVCRLVVPSHHSADVFAASGVRVPIDVIPYGIDCSFWKPPPTTPSGPFTVLVVGDLTDRKSPFEAVVAFQRAFPVTDDVRLVLKTYDHRLGRGAWPVITDPRITVIDATYTPEQLYALYAQASCFLWLSKGEGFGLPPLQAMAMGIPVVLTTHTGMAEYYDPSVHYGVAIAEEAPSPLYGTWYLPDVDHAAEQLQRVYTSYTEARRRARKGVRLVRERFSYEALTRRIHHWLTSVEWKEVACGTPTT